MGNLATGCRFGSASVICVVAGGRKQLSGWVIHGWSWGARLLGRPYGWRLTTTILTCGVISLFVGRRVFDGGGVGSASHSWRCGKRLLEACVLDGRVEFRKFRHKVIYFFRRGLDTGSAGGAWRGARGEGGGAEISLGWRVIGWLLLILVVVWLSSRWRKSWRWRTFAWWRRSSAAVVIVRCTTENQIEKNMLSCTKRQDFGLRSQTYYCSYVLTCNWHCSWHSTHGW